MPRRRLTVEDLFQELYKLVDEGVADTVITVQAMHEGTYKGVEGVGFDRDSGRVILYVSDGE